MSTTVLVTLRSNDEDGAVRATGVEVLARYPNSMLVRGSGAQVRGVERLGVETTTLGEQEVFTNGNSFSFTDAVLADASAPVEPPPDRTAYYLVRLAGPPAPEWLAELRALGAAVHDSLAGFTLLAGMPVARVAELRDKPWVDGVTPYRPAMKVSPEVRRRDGGTLGVAALAAMDGEDGDGDRRRMVEVSVFPGESLREVSGAVREAGGSVLWSTDRTLVASVRAGDLAALAGVRGVQAVLPHVFPRELNDRARTVMRVPPDNVFSGHRLTGADQIVAVADSGLDTGDPATVHPDVRGRVAGIVSWPARAVLAPFTHDAPGHDDGPADRDSGHGTHVTGSVLGDGRAAASLGDPTVPAGVAPEARVFFQAIGQRLAWKSAAELGDPPDEEWPPPATGLYGLPDDLSVLFRQAYEAGARIHTNSWGAATAGAYPDKARVLDDFIWNNPDMLILFAAGNEGADRDADGVIDQTSVGSPATAKNCLAVGAGENDRPAGSRPRPGRDVTWDRIRDRNGALRWPRLAAAGHVSDNADGMAAFSSRGPAAGGRIKPDVVAPGTNILSLLSSVLPADAEPLWGRVAQGEALRPFYCWSGGTSMATPLVAGAAALVRQHLVHERRHEPSAALLKAFLVNGAVPMAGQFPGEVPSGPNMVSGFGRVDVARSVTPRPENWTLFADDPAEAVRTGEGRLYRLEGVDPGLPLAVTLVWTDAPSLNGNGGLVNELYLRVALPGGGVAAGDVSPFPHPVNNVQRIVVGAPAEGPYVIQVFGASVTRNARRAALTTDARQDFALVASNGETLTRVR
ncbi:hypothetical protein Ssi03_30760 [Sphaerisporangium siamense]|uniref:Subtilisin family serine protease n=1 Tax=Sphaerisporangium siamense TaxID=795645 RepID=A0A7W7DCE6_9ACTN|nr:S8 family serine peptidase [Sphaerisporangium siamense]MBB4704232.1 subtilisin family serine protease [Sphaerisporangium siamense]GII85086.1 hypothetical protein Ssi03_30760 [Sphaerisporangium siamense]